ncbi:aminotransferase class I/II-fold pyridoxal phosphate-dependent enzyme [Paenalkalicoccus suaedae]|uniref:homocysteine desulfhydrase n=1 Tax=Paenalkalicoccus suaedae TaxID=2592382 RepID=A0A859FBP5_9BACI|nr:aminotransferase class I/II-fold pyridoxal phosphate-dependent enzyme [Paenalkalicoccus suaedae]QKS70202.1 aminotransferase class I/II-fold pyridoxal phosphate-dependent enzyme [Paenalkalicoccus suaedae]
MRFDTMNVHFPTKEQANEVSKTKPIYQTSAFTFKDFTEMEEYYQGNKNYLYTRMGNPNNDDLGKGVADLEGAEMGVATSSGLSAILAGVLAVAKTGDHIIATEDLYGGTYSLFKQDLADFGIEVSFIDLTDREAIEASVKDNTVLLYSESITNPLLRVEDIEGLSQIALTNDIKLMIDNTFATPYLLRPHELGADIVVHSVTKYIGGHSDVTAGAVTGSRELMVKAKAKMAMLGSNVGPFDAWLASRGLKTLSLRMERQCNNAQKLARSLETADGVKHVYYPKAASTKGNGAIVTIELDDAIDVFDFSSKLGFVKVVPTLAGLETSISYPIATSHRSIPDELRQKLGVTAQTIRISVGIEDADDITEAFEKALQAVRFEQQA